MVEAEGPARGLTDGATLSLDFPDSTTVSQHFSTSYELELPSLRYFGIATQNSYTRAWFVPKRDLQVLAP